MKHTTIGPMKTAKVDDAIADIENSHTHMIVDDDGWLNASVRSPFRGRFGYSKLPVVVTVIHQNWNFGKEIGEFPVLISYHEADFVIDVSGSGEVKVHVFTEDHEHMNFMKDSLEDATLLCEGCPRCV